MLAHDVDSAAHGVEMLFLTYKMDGIWDFQKKKESINRCFQICILGQ